MSETQVEKKNEPITYVIRRGKEIEKFVGYTLERTYVADEVMRACDCMGFMNTTHCKHIEFKRLLDDFNVDEMVFFGETLGDCKPKTEEQMDKIMLDLIETLATHFSIVDIDVTRYIQNPAEPKLFNCIEFTGKRKKPTLIVGYTRGIMFTLKPNPL